jgi:hypothetical protein
MMTCTEEVASVSSVHLSKDFHFCMTGVIMECGQFLSFPLDTHYFLGGFFWG